ncbi:tripartite motif-containing protein 66 isoform X1 [Maylandia zebra]|uniref:tripartite motif-containing protein 66 isoform X1 n=1 Tax=Maylandia zebra TaxID=106582 RepID=UPI00403D299F
MEKAKFLFQSCSECTEPTLAQSLCTLCNKWLCYQCTDVHQHLRTPNTSQYMESHQQQRPSATQFPELHQRGSSSLPPTGQGPGSYPWSLLMCHSHRQEPLELFCESCDLLCCSSCHLSSHKNHRVVQIGKALQDQQWLFESLMVQVEEKRSAVENSAKQIEERLHGVKIAHRKAENQIKMAKMIMMNELNKRANLLIEQLEKIAEGFQQRLEDQLQGAIEICGQLDHIQKFITWAMTHHCTSPVLFSRALISLQMQQLLEASHHSDSWSPVKIKFNWDASYWTKQISCLGQLTVEGGNCAYPPGLACSSIMRPQPITCLTLPPVFHRGREPGCGYQACCEPQMCCLHGIHSQPDLPSLDKSQLDTTLYNSSCAQPAHISASQHQNQQIQRFWDQESSLQRPPPASPVPNRRHNQLSRSRASASQPQAADSQPHSQSKSYLSHHQHRKEVLPNTQARLSAERGRPNRRRGKLSTSRSLQQELSYTALERDPMSEENRVETHRVEETCGQIAVAERREMLDQELQQGRRVQSPVQQQQLLLCLSGVRKEQKRTNSALTVKDHRDARPESCIRFPGGIDQRSTSLEVTVTAHECVSDVQNSSRLSTGSVCSRRKRRSQSIPTELAAPSASPYAERPTGWARSLEAGAANKYYVLDPRQRRASDGVLCVAKETSTEPPLMSYKTEPDHPITYVNEEIGFDANKKCSFSSNSNSSDVQNDSARPRVPVICLERLKILVSQLPPHGRRQSDPLPASGTDKSETLPQGITGESETSGATRVLAAPKRQTCNESTAQSDCSDSNIGVPVPRKESTLLSADSEYVAPSFYELDLDSDSDPRSVSEEAVISQADSDPQLDSDASPDSDPNAPSSSEAELECRAEQKSAEMGLCGDSEPSLEYEADPESDAGPDGRGLDADTESGDAETESDIQPVYDPTFQGETDSDVVSDQPPDSQGSVASELDVDSEPELTTDDPQPLRSDLDEEIGPGQRPLLIANPVVPGDTEEVQTEQDSTELESEDFCAVCLIGGDLLCCDRCPKVFHLSCHIPPLPTFPSGDWVCTLCRDVLHQGVEYNGDNERASGENASANLLSPCDQKKCERLTLLILSNILSAPFQEPVSPLARHYYQIIKRPMDLSVIRAKLSKGNTQCYSSPDEFVADMYLMFRNCAKFNYPDSEVAQAGRSLEAFFTSNLKEVFPGRVFPMAEVDSDSDEYDEAYRTTESGFPWPERREQCHRKRKRRQSLKSRRHHF